MVNAALNDELEQVEYVEDKLFHLMVPQSCPGVPAEMLNPINTWTDKEAYRAAAIKLAGQFSTYFDKAYGDKNLPSEIVSQCPGK
jgi:phosphoenolpyruvate carboxykinase (ATP)